MGKTIWKKSTIRCDVELVESSNWKGGIPIDPKIPKLLVKINDRFALGEFFPTDDEFHLLRSSLDSDSLELIKEAFKIKEAHNQANLKNPESRKIERVGLG